MRYVDPDGSIIINSASNMMSEGTRNLGSGTSLISTEGCTLTSYVRMANALGANTTLDFANELATNNNLFTDGNLLTLENGANLVNALLMESGITDVFISHESSYSKDSSSNSNQFSAYLTHEKSNSEYFCNARIETSDSENTSFYGHTVSVDKAALVSDRCDGLPTNMKIRDTSTTGRTQINGDSSGRINSLERLDFFKINRLDSE